MKKKKKYYKNIIKILKRYLVINAFMHPKVSDLKSLKSILFDKILNYDLEIETIVKEISDFIP